MQLDRLTLAVRPRGNWEAIDLGFRLARDGWRRLWGAWGVTVLPLGLAICAIGYTHPWITRIVLMWLKPVYDLIVLHVISRQIFGEAPRPREVLRALGEIVRCPGLIAWLVWRRPVMSRSFDLPVFLLERQRWRPLWKRLRVLRKRDVLSAAQWTFLSCLTVEMALVVAFFAFTSAMLPAGLEVGFWDLVNPPPEAFAMHLLGTLFYFAAISVVEPCYVAGGFTLYLNRRTVLEGWDLELAFRRLAASRPAESAARIAA